MAIDPKHIDPKHIDPKHIVQLPAPINDGGDDACWLNRVCDDCGALIEDDKATECWRCGAPWDPDAQG